MDSNKDIMKPVCLKTILGYEFYDYDEIIMFRANHNYTDIFLDNGKSIIALYNLCTIAKNFEYDSFYRCHKSYIINLKHVHRFNISGKSIELTSGFDIPISKNKIMGFKKLFMKTQ